MNDQIAINFIEALEKLIQDPRQKELVFFVVGRTGWGKSSTVNSLVGKYVSQVNDDEPETSDVTAFEVELNGIKATVFDTPGLCDETGNDEKYINMIKSKVKNPDSMLYVSRLDETRPADDKRVIKIISQALGSRAWEYSVIVFTFANMVEPSQYQAKLNKKTQLVRQAIAESIFESEFVSQIPVVAIDNKSKTTLDGEQWLGKLYTAIVERVSKKGTIALLAMLTESINSRTQLNKKQKQIIRAKFVDSVFHTTTAAMGISVVIAGLLNAPVIIFFSGGGIIGTLIGTWLSKED